MIVVAAVVLAGLGAVADAPLVGPNFSPAFVLTSEMRDSVAFESDSLVEKRHAVGGTIFAGGRPQRYTLANGRKLRVGGSTKIGRYELRDGRVLAVESKRGYPRPYLIVSPSTRTIFFRIRSTARMAVFVDPVATARWTVDGARHALLERGATAPSWPHALAKSLDAFEYPRDWYRRAELEFAQGFAEPIRVTWVAFAAPDRYEIARVAALRSLGLRAAPVGSPAELERPQPPSEEALRLTVRIVGDVVIDPKSGRIEQ